ncbi:unnamed protein product [Nyctereutes procyonoides]|uniref:(raccoon dog) hypothetical protein n=1 Tax=Nyctereutes procyonoides TaxID=34880 RepID=A0A811YLT6_NYCPR|nr:unnamed protein product [Nyctereutes procyonoides]
MYLINAYLGHRCLRAEGAVEFTLSSPPCRREHSPHKRRENESSGPRRGSSGGGGGGGGGGRGSGSSSETPAQTTDRHTGKSAAQTKRQGAAGAGREQRRGSAGPRGGSSAEEAAARGAGLALARGCTRPRSTPPLGQRPLARHKQRQTASTSAPRTHHWELRNGGGRGGEAGGRARRSQSPPPASFEPARKTAEGVGRGGEGEERETGGWGGRRRSPPRASGACARPQPIGAQREDAGAGALGRRALDRGRAPPLLPQSPNKTRTRARAPEGPGGGAPPPGTRAPRPLHSGSGVGAPGERPWPLAFGAQRARTRSPPACSVLRYLCTPPFLAPAFRTASRRRSRCRSSSPPPLSSRPSRRALPPRPPARGPARTRTRTRPAGPAPARDRARAPSRREPRERARLGSPAGRAGTREGAAGREDARPVSPPSLAAQPRRGRPGAARWLGCGCAFLRRAPSRSVCSRCRPARSLVVAGPPGISRGSVQPPRRNKLPLFDDRAKLEQPDSGKFGTSRSY